MLISWNVLDGCFSKINWWEFGVNEHDDSVKGSSSSSTHIHKFLALRRWEPKRSFNSLFTLRRIYVGSQNLFNKIKRQWSLSLCVCAEKKHKPLKWSSRISLIPRWAPETRTSCWSFLSLSHWNPRLVIRSALLWRSQASLVIHLHVDGGQTQRVFVRGRRLICGSEVLGAWQHSLPMKEET